MNSMRVMVQQVLGEQLEQNHRVIGVKAMAYGVTNGPSILELGEERFDPRTCVIVSGDVVCVVDAVGEEHLNGPLVVIELPGQWQLTTLAVTRPYHDDAHVDIAIAPSLSLELQLRDLTGGLIVCVHIASRPFLDVEYRLIQVLRNMRFDQIEHLLLVQPIEDRRAIAPGVDTHTQFATRRKRGLGPACPLSNKRDVIIAEAGVSGAQLRAHDRARLRNAGDYGMVARMPWEPRIWPWHGSLNVRSRPLKNRCVDVQVNERCFGFGNTRQSVLCHNLFETIQRFVVESREIAIEHVQARNCGSPKPLVGARRRPIGLKTPESSGCRGPDLAEAPRA